MSCNEMTNEQMDFQPTEYHHWTSPVDRWDANPSMVFGEAMFIAYALMCTWHAWASGLRYRQALVAALTAGAANDLFFMLLPTVDNFWHAQFSVMLTERLPLYILCAYVSFVYTAAVLSRRTPGAVAQAALAGLIGCVFYAAYDLFGQKYLWWTWHDTDSSVKQRWLGVPYGSTMWSAVHCFCFAAALRFCADQGFRSVATVAVTTVATTPAMMLLMSVPQMPCALLRCPWVRWLPDDSPYGVPCCCTLVATLGLLSVMAFRSRGLHSNVSTYQHRRDARLRKFAQLYFLLWVVAVLAFDPATTRSVGVHQTRGPCGVEAVDLFGFTREQYLCDAEHTQDLVLDCGAATASANSSSWYAVCGREHQSLVVAVAAQATIAALGHVVV